MIFFFTKPSLESEKIFLDFAGELKYTFYMELNIEKIDNELNRIGKTWWWVSRELKTDWNKVKYWKKTRCLRGAEPIAKIFGIEPKDLIK